MENVTVVFFPYAGGSSFCYQQALYGFGEKNSIHTIDYAGHGKRFKAPLNVNLEELVEDVLNQLERVSKKNLVLFGHSMGALVSAYVAERLNEKMPGCIKKLILSSCATPSRIRTKMNKCSTDSELFDYLLNERRIPNETLFSKYGIDPYWKVVKNDFKIMREFDNRPLSLPECPLYCIYADEDKDVGLEDVEEWKNYARAEMKLYKVNGDHFYFEKNPNVLKELLQSIINQ